MQAFGVNLESVVFLLLKDEKKNLDGKQPVYNKKDIWRYWMQ